MKKLYYLIVLTVILGLVLTGCLLSNVGQVPTTGQSGVAYLTKGSSPSLVGLWHFDEGSGTTANDSSGNFNDGILMGDTSWTSGKFDNALSFDGDGDYVNCGDISTKDWSGLTTEAWVYWDGGTLSGYAGVYYKAYHNDIGRLLINGGGGILVQNGNGDFWSDPGVVPVNQWCHIAYVYDQSEGMEYIYVNGDKKGEQTRSGDITHNSTDFWIGYGWHGQANHVFSGLIDEVRIWDGALTAEDITYNCSLKGVTIDIKPGSDPNSINLSSKGVVPVAVLTTDGFDASTIDPGTALFAGALRVRWTMEDVDGDGDEDLLFHFKTQELELDGSSIVATLTGETYDGVNPIQGTDSVNIVKIK